MDSLDCHDRNTFTELLASKPAVSAAGPIERALIALVLDCVMTHESFALGRFLNLRPVAFLGTLSYSLYIWQQIFLNRYGNHFYNVFPLNVLSRSHPPCCRITSWRSHS